MKLKLASAILFTALATATVSLTAPVATARSSEMHSSPTRASPTTRLAAFEASASTCDPSSQLHARGADELFDAVRGSVSTPFDHLDASSRLDALGRDHREQHSVDSSSSSGPVHPAALEKSDSSNSRQRVAKKLLEKETEDLLASTSTSASLPEKAHIIESTSTPAGHYYARFKDGSVALVPVPIKDAPKRNLRTLSRWEKNEVDQRLDRLYKFKHELGWAAKERERVLKWKRANLPTSIKPIKLEAASSSVTNELNTLEKTHASRPAEKQRERASLQTTRIEDALAVQRGHGERDASFQASDTADARSTSDHASLASQSDSSEAVTPSSVTSQSAKALKGDKIQLSEPAMRSSAFLVPADFRPVSFSSQRTFFIPPKTPNRSRQFAHALMPQERKELLEMENLERARNYRRKAKQVGQYAPISTQHALPGRDGSASFAASHQNTAQDNASAWSPTFDGLEDIVSLGYSSHQQA